LPAMPVRKMTASSSASDSAAAPAARAFRAAGHPGAGL
jgi:hypothetical protein